LTNDGQDAIIRGALKYVDVIVERWQTATGKAAVLAADHRTFTEVKARRSPEAA